MGRRTRPGDGLARNRDADRRRGMPVALDRAGEPRRVPRVVDRGAYRVVRDALAAARTRRRRPWRSSTCPARSPCRSTTTAVARELEEVAELAAALGGGLTAARRTGGFRVRAWLPTEGQPPFPQRRSQRVERRPARAAAADRAEHGAGQRRLGDVAGDDGRLAVGAHEVGQQRHRLAVGDQREQHQQVVGAVADVGLEAAERAAGADRQLAVVAVVLADRPRLVAQRGERDRPAARGQRVARRGSIDPEAAPRSSGSRSSRGSGGRGRNGYWSPSTRSSVPERERRHRRLRLGVGRPRRAAPDARRRSRAQRGREQVQARPTGSPPPARVPVICSAVASRSASASSMRASSASVWPTSVCAAAVSRTLRPTRSSSGTPASCSSSASCWETADGL